MTQQTAKVPVPERPAVVAAVSEQPAESAADGDEALVTSELLVEEISIDGMCGVY